MSNDYTYFEWLLTKIDLYDDAFLKEEDIHVAEWLFHIPYEWHFVMDENRAIAGVNLRKEYALECGVEDPNDIANGSCSILEMLVALAMRFSENADISVPSAYYKLCSNIGITPEELHGATKEKVVRQVEQWMHGDQDVNGCPGPFILKHYDGDARNLDVWSLMNIYIGENYPLKNNWLE